jgi:hypothetical protein
VYHIDHTDAVVDKIHTNLNAKPCTPMIKMFEVAMHFIAAQDRVHKLGGAASDAMKGAPTGSLLTYG